MSRDRTEILDEISKLLGKVPGFMKTVPEKLLGPRWEEFRILQLEDTEIPAKYKQLIMLAVSTYAKCRYCIEFHAEAAKLFGATDEEIKETAALTGNTALWSNFLQGVRYDYDAFEEEVRQTVEFVKNKEKEKAKEPATVGAGR